MHKLIDASGSEIRIRRAVFAMLNGYTRTNMLCNCGSAVRVQVVNDLAQFLASLRSLRAAYEACAVLPGWTRLYPAHGQMVDSRAAAIAKLDEYIAHRRSRVLQVLTALRVAGADAALNVEQIVDRVYLVRTVLVRVPCRTSCWSYLLVLVHVDNCKLQ